MKLANGWMRLSILRIIPLAAAALLPVCGGGCAEPSPAPVPPRVAGLDTYVSGAQAYDAGQDDQARLMLQQAVQKNDNLTMAHQLLGDIYRKQKDFQQAANQYQAVARLDPYNYKSHYNLGLMDQFMGRLEQAITAYLQALTLSPRDLNSNINLGVVYLALGQNQNAIRQLQKAVSIDPDSAAAQFNLGVALDIGAQPLTAELAYRRAIELDPNLTAAMLDLGANLIRQRRGAEAEGVLRQAAAQSSTPVAYKLLGDALVLQRRDDQAKRQYDAALQLNPDYWPAMNQLGMIDLRQYQAGLTLNESLHRSAVQLWQRSLALNPRQPAIRGLLAKWNRDGQIQP
jgi:tetratricopeptide (TPR) repeat protein